MELIPVGRTVEENEVFFKNPLCSDTIYMTIDFYSKIGYEPPWIGYYASQNGNLVGAAGFKGKPVEGTVEIAYGTFEPYRKQGVGNEICRQLVRLALATDPAIRITARTLPQENFSTRILQKNNFVYNGIVHDPEDGDVWEWVYSREG